MKNHRLAYWLCQILGWGSYTAVSIYWAVKAVGWSTQLVVDYAIYFACILLLTHLLRGVIRKRNWLSLPMHQAALRLIGAATLTGLCSAIEIIAVARVGGDSLWTVTAVAWTVVGLVGVCNSWMLLYVAITTRRHAVEMRLVVREAQLQALEAQVNPHFLFNSLNTIRGMIAEDPAVAQDMVTRLANILRYNLQREKNSMVPLDREIEVVADYLAIESIRFDDRLTVRMEIDPAARHAQVPSMLMQTLVENAVKHGIGARNEGGEIVIRASIRDGMLFMEVVNSGQLAPPTAETTQIGLSNARARLQLLYGDRATLKIENRDPSTVAALVSIPA